MSYWVDSRRKIAISERKLHVKELQNKPCESRTTDTNPENLIGELHSTNLAVLVENQVKSARVVLLPPALFIQ